MPKWLDVIPKCRAVLRELVQPSAHERVVRLHGPIADHRAVNHKPTTGAPLAYLVGLLRPSEHRAPLP
jgi:hypothetical protein